MHRQAGIACVAAAAIALTACAHNGRQDASNGVATRQTANPSPSVAANPPNGGVTSSGMPVAPGAFATVPPKLICPTSLPVWVDPATHVYHTSGDPKYGRTPHGKYLCLADAKRQGYKRARLTHGR